MLMKFKYEKEFREAHPETTGEKDSAFDLCNYTEWLETIVSRVELPVKPEIAEIDNYLRTVTTFMVISKDLIKEEINNVIDKKFLFIENDIKKANDAIYKIKKQFSV